MHISCTICTELYQASEETGITKCGHLFHMNCITPWLQKHKTCPHCRANTSVCDLIRVFFTEISSENVHLDRNCKIAPLEAITASEKEHFKKIQIDLKQAKNDLIDMNKHIERYENEIKKLKILNESLSENNTKIESDNKKLIKKIRIANTKKSFARGEYTGDLLSDPFGMCHIHIENPTHTLVRNISRSMQLWQYPYAENAEP